MALKETAAKFMSANLIDEEEDDNYYFAAGNPNILDGVFNDEPDDMTRIMALFPAE